MSNASGSCESTPMFYIGFCKQCGTGPLGLRTCGVCTSVVVVCDECDSVWGGANLSDPPATTGTTTLPCPRCRTDLYALPAHWSTQEEIDHASWLADAVAEGRLSIQVAKPRPTDASCD